jgi:CBS domain-containing protein
VKELMSENVFTINHDEEVVFAFEKLMKHKISALPVVDNKEKMIGIVTASDLGHNLILDNYKLGTKVSEVMVKEVTYVTPNDTLKDTIHIMNENAPEFAIINQVPVLDNGKIIGIISDGDIIKALKDI